MVILSVLDRGIQKWLVLEQTLHGEDEKHLVIGKPGKG
jgi:hypothetical protein